MSDSNIVKPIERTYVPLHCHSYFSLLDGMASPEEIAKRAKEVGCPGVALTDHGSVAGIYRMYKACNEQGIKPILGMEGYFVENMQARNKEEIRYHLTLWAKNTEGYRNLLALSSYANLNGFYNRPRIDMNLLRRHSAGLMVGSACPQGILAKPIRMGQLDFARKRAKEFQELFKDDFYIEIMGHVFYPEKKKDEDEFKKAMKDLYALSQELGITAIWTGDSHYCRPEDKQAHDIVLSMATKDTVKNKDRFTFSSDDFYIKTPKEAYLRCRGFEHILENTNKLLAKVEDNIIVPSKDLLPEFPIPSEYASQEAYLKELLSGGMVKRGIQGKKVYVERMRHEFSVIQKTGYTRYFLILHDFVNYARSKKIRLGPGRGSGVSSLALYCLGVTAIDPIKHKLMFSRFLNEDRVSPPDVDIDFDHDFQADMFKYLVERYGADNVVRIGTYAGLKAKEAIRRVSKALDIGKDFESAKEDEHRNWKTGKKTMDLADALAKCISDVPNTDLDNEIKDSQELAGYAKRFPEVFKYAKRLQGVLHSAGAHPSGVIVCKEPVILHTPLRIASGSVCTQYDMKEVEKLGLLKFDILALNTLTMIELCLKLVKERYGKEHDLNLLDPDADPSVFKILREGKTDGVFQFEKHGITQLLQNMRVDRFEDMVASVAIYRPGPLKSNVDKDYCDYKLGHKEIVYYHPALKESLADTFGLMCYQEDIINVVQKMAGYTASQADMMRKAVGKKDPVIMEKEKIPFVDGCLKNGIDREIAEKTFERIAFFAGYGFNRCLAGDTKLIDARTGKIFTVKQLCNDFVVNKNHNVHLHSYLNGKIAEDELMDVFETGEKDVYEVKFSNGVKINCTMNHKFMCEDGKPHEVSEILEKNLNVIDIEQKEGVLVSDNHLCKIISVTYVRFEQTYNLTMKSKQHNYLIPGKFFKSGVISLNSHAAAYAFLAFQTAWLKRYYPTEFFCALISTEKDDDQRLVYERAAQSKHNISFLPYHINKSKLIYSAEGNSVRRPLTSIKGVGDKAAAEIVAKQPYASLDEFVKKVVGVNQNVFQALVEARAMEVWGIKRDDLVIAYERAKKSLLSEKRQERIHGETDGSLFDVPTN